MITKVLTVLGSGFACTATSALFSLPSNGPNAQLLLISFVFGIFMGALALMQYGSPAEVWRRLRAPLDR